MPHVTFIHGILNKPPKEKLLQDWEASLAQGGLDLAAAGVTTSMVYWADVMYPEPEQAAGAYEAVDGGLGTAESDEKRIWAGDLPAEEEAFIAAFRDRLRFDQASPEGDDYTPPVPPDRRAGDGEQPISFEAVPLPWFIKRRAMKRLLKDVYYYLFNKPFSPREGETYQVRDHIRRLFVDQIRADSGANADGGHAVVSHSMGTVISYDCLKNVAECPPIDGYMTVGSPLGISEVFDNLTPGYSRDDGFPSGRLGGDWVNVYDRLDPVAFDARIADDYQRGGTEVILDQRVVNGGRWRHSSWKYFGQGALVDHLGRFLDL